jgi:CubicO group peptidase (beta-lactamase class C family)
LNDHTTLYTSPESPLPKYSLVTYPDGGLITNVHDLSKYLTELIKGKQGAGTLLNQESFKEIFTEQLSESHLPGRDEDDAYDDEYNSGIFMGFTPKGYIGHTGGDPGVASFMFFKPETNVGRILTINTRISSQEGVDQFYAIWNTLEKYEALIQ